jgi:hypothetical protein
MTRAALVTCDSGEPCALTDTQISSLIASSLAAQKPLFREMIAWTDSFKIAYGAYHYLDFLAIFFQAAGASEVVLSEARERFQQTLDNRLRELAEAETLPVWDRMFARPTPLFTAIEEAR